MQPVKKSGDGRVILTALRGEFGDGRADLRAKVGLGQIGPRGYGIGFIVFVFLALLSLAMTWVLKYGAARAASMPPATAGVRA